MLNPYSPVASAETRPLAHIQPSFISSNLSEAELVALIQQKEATYMERIFSAFQNRATDIRSWFDMANQVRETWTGRLGIDPRNEIDSAWSQVSENVFVGAFHTLFPNWIPIGLPIGSDTIVASDDTVIHIDLKTHREGDSDLDRTQDVRPEQVSGEGDYRALFSSLLPQANSYVHNLEGQLGDMPPKLPPYYDFGNGNIKLCVTIFIICIYSADLNSVTRSLSRAQLFCVPNGVLRHLQDYRDIFQVGKDGRNSHRYRVNLQRLTEHEDWRWRELSFQN